ncbi:MAG TPA: Crp/Fnr family transcriptional regulator [Gillisia sp.]|nr:Crp/Fnr family transcriptional regulator [Gillisia sp.]
MLSLDKIRNNCPLIKDLDEDSREELLSLFCEKSWPQSTCILNPKKLSLQVYIILSGRIKMYQVAESSGKEITMFLLQDGDIIDLFCLLDNEEHKIFYECLDEVKVLAAPMAPVQQWLIAHPEQYAQLLNYAGRQMRLLESYVSDISFSDVSTRLLKLLKRNLDESYNLRLINNLPNKEIAWLIGSTGVVVNRHLQKLKRNGCIKTSRNSIEIENIKSLLRMLETEKQTNLL